MRRFLAASVLLACVATTASAQELDPAALVAQLESRLLAAQHVAIEATITAQGVIGARLAGRSELLDRNRATWSYRGEFAGKPADLAFGVENGSLKLRSGTQARDEPVGRESNRALLLGLTRMGLLHNLSRLSSLLGPDHAQGGVDPWITLDSFRPITYAQGGDLEGLMSFGFDLVVAGTPAASARLWLDPASGLPRRRQQVVRFPQGEMTVVEDYTRFEVK